MIYSILQSLYFPLISLDSCLILSPHDLANQLTIPYYRVLYILQYTLIGWLLLILLTGRILNFKWFLVHTFQGSNYISFWWWCGLVAEVTIEDKLLFKIGIALHVSLNLGFHISVIFIQNYVPRRCLWRMESPFRRFWRYYMHYSFILEGFCFVIPSLLPFFLNSFYIVLSS